MTERNPELPKRKLIIRRTLSRRLFLDSKVLDRLEELQIVIPIRRPGKERAYSPQDADRLRVYALLVNDLDVNPPGAEIILRMRTQLLTLRNRLFHLFTRAQAQGMLEDLQDLLDSLEDDPS